MPGMYWGPFTFEPLWDMPLVPALFNAPRIAAVKASRLGIFKSQSANTTVLGVTFMTRPVRHMSAITFSMLSIPFQELSRMRATPTSVDLYTRPDLENMPP